MTDIKKRYSEIWNVGDVVYFPYFTKNRYCVDWGIVDEVWHDGLFVDRYELKETRLVNGIPIDEFESETKWHKLPKGWTYNTKLFEVTYAQQEAIRNPHNMSDPDDIKCLIKDGWLVPSSTIFHGEIRAEIGKEGYRIIKSYPVWYMSNKKKADYTFITFDKAYKEWDECCLYCSNYYDELLRQASLSDEDWSKEKINKVLSHWQKLYGKTDLEVENMQRKLFSMTNVADLEVRLSDGQIQCKYVNKKKWVAVEE